MNYSVLINKLLELMGDELVQLGGGVGWGWGGECAADDTVRFLSCCLFIHFHRLLAFETSVCVCVCVRVRVCECLCMCG